MPKYIKDQQQKYRYRFEHGKNRFFISIKTKIASIIFI